MGLFTTRKPRGFHHNYIYYDPRKEKLQKIEENAKREMGVLPPGDIRNCIAALADDEDLVTKLFQYRFDMGEGKTAIYDINLDNMELSDDYRVY